MQRVLDRIAARTAEYARGAFFAFLADEALEPRRKLAFAPYSTHFVMTFADLSAFVFRREPARDRYQEIVNATSREDEGHWRWFLKDLDALGYDRRIPYSETVEMIWSEHSARLRKLSYRLCGLAQGGDSLDRLVLLWCMEESFRASIGAVLPHAMAFSAQSGRALAFFGPGHSDAEEAHPIHEGDVRAELADVALPDEKTAALCAMIDEVFVLLAGFAGDLLALSNLDPPAAPESR